jgi:hypothetical protein
MIYWFIKIYLQSISKFFKEYIYLIILFFCKLFIKNFLINQCTHSNPFMEEQAELGHRKNVMPPAYTRDT